MLCNSFYIEFKNGQNWSVPFEVRSHYPCWSKGAGDRRTQGDLWNLLSCSGPSCLGMYHFVKCPWVVHFSAYILYFTKIFLKIKKRKPVWALSVLTTIGCVGNTAPVIYSFPWFSCLNVSVHFNVSTWIHRVGLLLSIPHPRSPEGINQRGLFSTYFGSLPGQAPNHTCPQCRHILHLSSGHQLLLSAKTKHISSTTVRLFPVPPAFTALREWLSGAPVKQQGLNWGPQGNAMCAINSLPDLHVFHAVASIGKTGYR